MPDFAAYTAVARTNLAATQRLITDNQQVQSSRGTFAGLKAFFSNNVKHAQNRAALQDLQAALSTRFGGLAAGQAMINRFGGALATGAVSLHKSDVAALIAGLQAQETQMLAQGNLGAAARKADHALGQIKWPNPELRQLAEPILRGRLERIALSTASIDRSDGAKMLAQMGNQMANIVDRHLSTALHAYGQTLVPAQTDVQAVMTALNGGVAPTGMARLTQLYPNVTASIVNECQLFETAMGSMARRFAGELPNINNAFANVWPNGTPNAVGVTGIKVTDSDPHHGGNRVCILTLDNGQTLVYKPRDCRIDSKLTGSGAHGNNVANMSVMQFTDRLLQRNGVNGTDVPKLRYHCAQEALGGHQEHFAFVQCLSNGTRADCSVDDQGGRQYYTDLGRSAAALMLFGTRDLHQRNVMTSGGRPYFTDVEISFDQSMLATLTNDLNAAPPAHGNPPLPQMFSRSQFTGAIINRHEAVRNDPVTIENGQFVPKNGNHEEAVTDSFLHVRGRGGNDRVALHQTYSAEFAQGFKDVLQAFRAEQNRNPSEIATMLGGFANLHVRFHPIATGEHLGELQKIKGTINIGAQTAVAKTNQLQQDAHAKVAAALVGQGFTAQLPLHDIEANLAADWSVGDVPYFTRDVSDRRLMHNGHTAVDVSDPNGVFPPHTDFFAEDPMTSLTNAFAQLGATPTANLDSMANGVQHWLSHANVVPTNAEVRRDFDDFYREQRLA
jgi:hypothetical protein